MTRLKEHGLPVVEYRMGFRSMSAPLKEFEAATLSGKLRHGGNLLLRWCFSNMRVDRDPAGNLKPDKARSQDMIDAAVSTVMAIGAALADGVLEPEPYYVRHGLLVLGA
jgi:phage terminase large subunit-like protein